MDPTTLLQDIAQGSFRKVVEQNNKLILIEVDTVKVKNKVLREFVQKARDEGYNSETILDLVLQMDEAVEKNEVRKVIKQFIE